MYLERVNHPEGEVTIAIVGKYTQLEDAYKSFKEALTHGGMANRVKVNVKWVDAEVFDKSRRRCPAPRRVPRHPSPWRLWRARH